MVVLPPETKAPVVGLLAPAGRANQPTRRNATVLAILSASKQHEADLLGKPRDRLHDTLWIAARRRLPLPKGERWGEGEQDWRLPRIRVHAADLAVPRPVKSNRRFFIGGVDWAEA